MKKTAKNKKLSFADNKLVKKFGTYSALSQLLMLVVGVIGIILLGMGIANLYLDYQDKQRFLAAAKSVEKLAERFREVDPEVEWEVKKYCDRKKVKWYVTPWGCEIGAIANINVPTVGKINITLHRYSGLVDYNKATFKQEHTGGKAPLVYPDIFGGNQYYSISYSHPQFSKGCNMNYKLEPSLQEPINLKLNFRCADEARHSWFPRTTE